MNNRPSSTVFWCTLLAALFFGGATSAEKPKPAKGKPAGKEIVKPGKNGALFDGKTLRGWRAATKFDFEKHGKVEVKKGELLLGKGQPATGVVWQGKPPRVDYELSLQARRTEGSDFFCGLTFPVGQEYCSLIIGGWGGGVTGLSNIDGMSAVENETTGYVDFQKNKWYPIRLRVSKEKIEAWVGKEQIVDLKTKDRKFSIWWEQEPMRPLGVATWNTAGALRDIRLQPLNKIKSDVGDKKKSD